MESLKVTRFIRTDEGDIELTVYASPSKIGFVGISIDIECFNNQEIDYTYSTEKDVNDDNKYIDAIKEAIETFKQDEALIKLFNWDSVIK